MEPLPHQQPDLHLRREGRGHGSSNNPQAVVAVNVQDPNRSNQDYFGDMVAGPVFYNVMENAIAELGIQPQIGLVPPDVRLNAP